MPKLSYGLELREDLLLVADEANGMPSQPFPALLYVATPSNRLWLGDAPLACIASQIVSCSGATGHNVEYLLRLAEYMRAAAPEADDDHLFSLESLVRDQIRKRRLCLETLMGGVAGTAAAVTTTVLPEDGDEENKKGEDKPGHQPGHQPGHHEPHHPEQPAQPAQPLQQPQAGQEQRPDGFAFTSRVPNKKLRCLNI